MKQCNIEVGKVYILDDGEEVCIEHLCGVLYASYVDEYDKSVLIHTDRIVKEVGVDDIKVWWIDYYGKLHTKMIQPCEIEQGEYTSLEDLNRFVNDRINKLENDLRKYKKLKENINDEKERLDEMRNKYFKKSLEVVGLECCRTIKR